MKINMAHGSGGKASAELMKEIFGKYLSNLSHFKNNMI